MRYAEAYGIREAARAFRASRGTVRLWLGRYRAEGARGLVERSRAPARAGLPLHGRRALRRVPRLHLPRWPNANADVEAFHRLTCEEFFEPERFASLEDFLREATLCQHASGFARPNSYRGSETPCEIVSADHPAVRPKVLLRPPVLLEAEVGRHPLGGGSTWTRARRPVRSERLARTPRTYAPWGLF